MSYISSQRTHLGHRLITSIIPSFLNSFYTSLSSLHFSSLFKLYFLS